MYMAIHFSLFMHSYVCMARSHALRLRFCFQHRLDSSRVSLSNFTLSRPPLFASCSATWRGVQQHLGLET